jgi:glucosyl-3-phosphoglycerate synthase
MSLRLRQYWMQVLTWVQHSINQLNQNTSEPKPDVSVAPLRLVLSKYPLAGSVSVIIPALNEAKRIADVVRYAFSDPATGEVIVIDDSSIDDTALLAREAGARVVTSSMLGKGASMKDGSTIATFDVIVYLDGDLAGLRPNVISTLAEAVSAGEADFVKARFGRGGGRVTELTAKPMLKVFFPELAGYAQPLGGLICAHKGLLKQLSFEDGYGVDVGLLIDAWRLGARLHEVNIGSLQHESQSLQDLSAMAIEVSRVIYSRAREVGRLHVDQITAMYEAQREVPASFEHIVALQRGRRRLVLLDMSVVLSDTNVIDHLARTTGQEAALDAANSAANSSGQAATQSVWERQTQLAALFRFVHRQRFEQVAHELPIQLGAIEAVNTLRRHGVMVGLVCDGYFVIADIVRRRVFADFAVAHLLQFQADVCTGELKPNGAFGTEVGAIPSSAAFMSHDTLISRFKGSEMQPELDEVLAIDDFASLHRLAEQYAHVAPETIAA